MGIAERKEREKAARRRNILACTKELIMLQGVERVSMEDIAQKAELSKATLYLYFANKEAIFNEICEESARGFLEYLGRLSPDGTGIAAIRYLWRGYVSLFGDSDEMLIVFQVRSFLASWLPPDPQQIKSPHIGAIITAIHTMIEQCKAEGIFAADLNSAKAVRMMLLLFSTIVQNTARLPPEARNSPAMIREMTNTFQIIIRGFAREGIEHSRLDITGAA
ncbi:MAG: TetR/AcrR family transcriptional regulator [Treponema sp.]|nr:TetR/AcrR family transcriptional regulator [Treponema sp.]